VVQLEIIKGGWQQTQRC